MKTTEQILNENGLNWNVTKEPLMYSGMCTPEANNGLHSTDYYGIVREDTGQVFATVKKGYTPTQNSTIIDTMQSIAGNNDLIITKALPINGGRKILVQMQKPNNTVIIGDQPTEQYVYAINSHDGTSALKFGFMNQVIYCSNQFAWMNSNGLKGYVHKQSIQNKVSNLPEILNLDGQEERIAQLHEMSFQRISGEQTIQLIDYLTGMDSKQHGWPDTYTTRKMNIRDDLSTSIARETNRLGMNKWGLFNGITMYTSHHKSIPSRAYGREESIYTGTGQKMTDTAFNWLQKN
tara:strand:+ start:2252 stop:3127 length:876 start_codon:yes stop_codon:yes gene_type:complete